MSKKIEVNGQDLDQVSKIIQVDEHDPKYFVPKNKLEEANKKMTEITKKRDVASEEQIMEKTLKKRKGLVARGSNIIRKRSAAQTKKVWEKFLKEEESDFFETMGYGRRKIEKIGIEKFLDSVDWKYPTDVKSWRTDKLHVIPCIHCRDDFAIYEELGLCGKCRKKYNLDAFHAAAIETEKEIPNSLQVSKELFVFDKETRDIFLEEKGDE